MNFTKGGENLIKALENNGFEAYAVGGAVRDFLRGVNYSDVDITTSATPDEMLEVFKDYKVYKTGIKHGTVTVNVGGENIEITTFRTEKGYSDNRRPDQVTFVRNLEEDLKRRDFTVNAMAYNDSTGVIDMFGGQADLKNKIIRTVGNPDERFNEDALRILRGLRFASVLDFEIEENTKKSILKNYRLLSNVAIERVYIELTKLLMGKGVGRILLEFKEVFFHLIPKLKDCDGFLQQSKFHCYDVYTHIVKSVENSPCDKIVRWALLLHDIEKPNCFTVDSNGVGHFYGHQKLSAETSREILRGFKSDNYTINTVNQLIFLHDIPLESNSVAIKQFLNKYGYSFLKQFTGVRIGDALAHAEPYGKVRVENANLILSMADEIVKSGECYTLKRLAVNGDDLKALGYKGVEIKQKLDYVLNLVIKGKINNEKQDILSVLKK